MCGISVVLDRAGRVESAAALSAMHEPIRHRGPDGEGFARVDGPRLARLDGPAALSTPPPFRVGLAFRRLRIIDLSESASQPMVSPDGRVSLVFNGEIYNFRELRRELEARGRTFRSTCDTEVALAAYEAWGERAFERLDGMWAMVLVDLRSRRIVGSRDRFGIKPLYYALDGDRLLLGSEIKQLLAARRTPPRLNAPLVGMYLRGARYPCLEETFFEEVRAVPPATWFEVALDGGPLEPPTFRRYWDLGDFVGPDAGGPHLSYDAARDALRSLLASAVESHHVADVTVGSLLSGGLDSALLTSLLVERARREGRHCPTFSFGFGPAAPEVCELRYAEALVRRDGLVNHQTTFDAAWVLKTLPSVLWALEEPPLGLPALAQYRVFELAREHGATVVLDGEGADEILAGYPFNQRTLLWDRLRRARLGEFARELRAIAAREGRAPAAVLTHWFAAPAWRRLRGRRRGWVAPDFGTRSDPTELVAAARDRGRDPSALNRELYYSVRWGNVKIVLGYTDRNSMAHSVEARVPYFDRKLVEFAFSLPDHYKVGDGQRKRILRDVARERLPREITDRVDRMGFATPDLALLRGPLWPAVREVVRDPAVLASACLDRPGALAFIDGFEAGRHADCRGIWRLYALACWSEVFQVTLP